MVLGKSKHRCKVCLLLCYPYGVCLVLYGLSGNSFLIRLNPTFCCRKAYCCLKSYGKSDVECEISYLEPERACWNTTQCSENVILEVNASHCTDPSTRRLVPPVYVYYHLSKFYQNIDLYQNSIDPLQFKGTETPNSIAKHCRHYISDTKARMLNPCGLISLTVFNDTFTFLSPETSATLDESKEALYTFADRLNKVHPRLNSTTSDAYWINEEIFPGSHSNPHFRRWIHTTFSSDFRKLYGILHSAVDLPMTFFVQSRYPMRRLLGTKTLLIRDSRSSPWIRPAIALRIGVLAAILSVVSCIQLILGTFLVFNTTSRAQPLE